VERVSLGAHPWSTSLVECHPINLSVSLPCFCCCFDCCCCCFVVLLLLTLLVASSCPESSTHRTTYKPSSPHSFRSSPSHVTIGSIFCRGRRSYNLIMNSCPFFAGGAVTSLLPSAFRFSAAPLPPLYTVFVSICMQIRRTESFFKGGRGNRYEYRREIGDGDDSSTSTIRHATDDLRNEVE